MAKHKKHPEHENLERWLVSYADFITLLFATFTALYAIAQADLSKFKDVATAIKEGFVQQSLISGIKSVIQGKSPPTENPDPIASDKGRGSGVLGDYERLTYMPGEVKAAQEMTEKLYREISEINTEIQNAERDGKSKRPSGGSKPGQAGKAGGGPASEESQGTPRAIELSIQERGIKVSFDTRLLFESGSAVLKPSAKDMLNRISDRLKNFAQNHLLQVEGHTDDQPIATAVYPSNWELSTARASSVVRYLISTHRFDPKYLAAMGYADSRPIASNLTPEGRARNRRIDIIIYSKASSMQIDPSFQNRTEKDIIGSESKGKSILHDAKIPAKPIKPAPPKTTAPHSGKSPASSGGKGSVEHHTNAHESPPVPPHPTDKAETGHVEPGDKGFTPVRFGEIDLPPKPKD